MGFASASLACAIVAPKKNMPVLHGADCSFSGGGAMDWNTGESAQNAGEGRVFQILHIFGGTAVSVVDCFSGEAATIIGRSYGEETSCGRAYEIESQISPNGSLDLSADQTLSELVIHANSLGLKSKLGTAWIAAGLQNKKDIPNLYCGCGIFYPKHDYLVYQGKDLL